MTEFALSPEAELQIPSPTEIAMLALRERIPETTIPHVIVGPADHEQQQDGVASLMLAGRPKVDEARCIRSRIQVRVIAPTLAEVEQMVFVLDVVAQLIQREVIRQVSTGYSFLLHFITISAGPSLHNNEQSSQEALIFLETLISLDPVSGPNEE